MNWKVLPLSSLQQMYGTFSITLQFPNEQEETYEIQDVQPSQNGLIIQTAETGFVKFLNWSDLSLEGHKYILSNIQQQFPNQYQAIRESYKTWNSNNWDHPIHPSILEQLTSSQIVSLAIRSENTEFLEQLYRRAISGIFSDNYDMLLAFAQNPATSQKTLHEMAKEYFNDKEICRFLAQNPKIHEKTLFALASNPYTDVKKDVLAHPKTDRKILKQLANTPKLAGLVEQHPRYTPLTNMMNAFTFR